MEDANEEIARKQKKTWNDFLKWLITKPTIKFSHLKIVLDLSVYLILRLDYRQYMKGSDPSYPMKAPPGAEG